MGNALGYIASVIALIFAFILSFFLNLFKPLFWLFALVVIPIAMAMGAEVLPAALIAFGIFGILHILYFFAIKPPINRD